MSKFDVANRILDQVLILARSKIFKRIEDSDATEISEKFHPSFFSAASPCGRLYRANKTQDAIDAQSKHGSVTTLLEGTRNAEIANRCEARARIHLNWMPRLWFFPRETRYRECG